MVNSLLLDQAKQLEESLKETGFKTVDIDYDLERALSNAFDTHTRGLIVHDEYAYLNAYRLWIQSYYFDYIRNPGFGGFFDYNLNDKFAFSPNSEEGVKSALLSESAQKWPQIEILDLRVKCLLNERAWEIHIVARDKLTGMVLGYKNPYLAKVPSLDGELVD